MGEAARSRGAKDPLRHHGHAKKLVQGPARRSAPAREHGAEGGRRCRGSGTRTELWLSSRIADAVSSGCTQDISDVALR